MRQSQKIEVANLTRGTLPRVPFALLTKDILPNSYELSVSFVGVKKMHELSTRYKGDPTHMNVLSFPISHLTGEIIMCPQAIRAEAKKFYRTYREHLIFLVIHGALHLAGYVHGSKMNAEEKRLIKKYGF